MASAALPPGFPAVEIEGKFYWDGALSGNTPIRHFIYSDWSGSALCFLVHLFSTYGLLPQTLNEVLIRKKDIEFSSQFSQTIDICKDLHCLKYTINELAKLIPAQKKDRRVKALIQRGADCTVSLVRFTYEGDSTDLLSKDYEFSEKSTLRHLEAGYADAKLGIRHSPWLAPIDKDTGVSVHDIAQLPPI